MVRFIQTVIGCLSLLLLCGCATTTPGPTQVMVSAGILDDITYAYPEICVVELENNEKQFIQPIPYQLSENLVSAVAAYNAELHEVVVVFACGWELTDEKLKGDEKTQPQSRSGTGLLEVPSDGKYSASFSVVEFVALSFSMPLHEDVSAELAKQTINRLLTSGFRLELDQTGEKKSKLLELDSDELINGAVSSDLVVNSASIKVHIPTGGTSNPLLFNFALDCDPAMTTLPLPVGSVTVPPMVGSSIPEDSGKLRLLTGASIDKSSRYRIEAWQFVGQVPKDICR